MSDGSTPEHHAGTLAPIEPLEQLAKLSRVADAARGDRLHQHRIDMEQREIRRDLELQPPLFQLLAELLDRSPGHLAQLAPFAVGLQSAITEAGHIEQVLHEAVQPLALV